MTVVIAFATADGYVSSSGTGYVGAVNSGSRNLSTTADRIHWGQRYLGGQYSGFESFLSFPVSFDAANVVPGAYFEFTAATSSSTGVNRSMEIYGYDWGASLETADWRTPAQLSALQQFGLIHFGEEATSGQAMRGGAASLVSWLNQNGGSLRVVVTSDRLANSITPSADESGSFWSVEAAGTANDPRLVYSTVRRSTLLRVGAAQVMLDDGSQVFLEYTTPDYQALPGTLLLRRRTTAGVVTTLGTPPIDDTSGSLAQGLIGGTQSYALSRDDDENLYLVSRDRAQNVIAGRCWVKGSGYTWAAKNQIEQAIPLYTNGFFDFYNMTWHAAGGAAGTLLAMVAAPPGSGRGGVTGGVDQQFQLLYINCDSLKSGSGSLLRGTGKYNDLFTNSPTGHSWFYNPWGNGFDLVATGATRGYAISQNADDQLHGDPAISRYTLNSNGVGFANVAKTEQAIGATGDAAGKLRVVRVSDSLFCASGGTTAFLLLQSIGNGAISTVARVAVSDLGLSSLASNLSGANGWDLMYDPTSNRLYLYYLDTTDSRQLRRTSFDVTNMTAPGESLLIATVGAAGSNNWAIRCHRGLVTTGNKVMISVANQAGSAHSTIYVDDTLNAAPSAPVLVQKSNYDATNADVFQWDFKDPNSSDTQSAYQIEITNSTTGVVAYDSGKVASLAEQHTLAANTLANGNSYSWRVRTWDAADVQGPYSSSAGFSTSIGGSVTITSPAIDNPPDLDTDEFPVTWSVTGTTQASYRVRVYLADTGTLVSDTGWVASTTATHTVSGLLSETRYEVQVTVRNAALVVTNTATRQMTPSYGRPETPSLKVLTVPEEGYARVLVDNPLPGQLDTGMAPNGFEAVGELADYAYSGATVTITGDNSFGGVSSARLAATGGDPVIFRRAVAGRIPVVGGTRYRFQFYGYAPAAINMLWRAIDWYDAAGLLIRNDGSNVSVPAGTWTEQTIVHTAPSNAATAGFGFDIGTVDNLPAAGALFYVDEMVLLGATDKPEATENRIYRRPAGTSGPHRLLGTVGLDGEYHDYEAAGGKLYDYVVRAVASNGGYSDSPTVQARLGLLGVWIHDPYDPAGTLKNYPFGKSNRSRAIDVSQGGQIYAGRKYPVVDYGEQQTDTLQVTVVVPTGPDWLTQLDELQGFNEARRTLCLRDNRGRVLFGTINGYRESDEDHGTSVSFSMDRVDYTIDEKWVSL